MEWDYKTISSVYGILAAVPCTDFAISGARHFATKDADGTTAKSIALVYKTIEIIHHFNPAFWVIENPMSRIHKCVPELGSVKFKFNPCDFAAYNFANGYTDLDEDRYNKQTWLWGKFNEPVKKYLEPLEKDCPQWRKYGGKSLKTKNARSATPHGFAKAFFEANQ
jgi:hypothetical protein